MNPPLGLSVGVACLTMALAGCASQGEEPYTDVDTEVDAEEIQGGEVEHGHPAVGLLWIESRSPRGALRRSLCTGTLVAPRVVLTAAHCTVNQKSADGEIWQRRVVAFYTGTGLPRFKNIPGDVAKVPQSPDLVAHAVSEQRTMPGYDLDTARCPSQVPDVGVVRLRQPVSGIAPLEMAESAVELPDEGELCSVVGFGTHGRGTDKSVGQKRSATVRLTRVQEENLRVRRHSGRFDEGDSGGPLLYGDTVVGVTSCVNEFFLWNWAITAYHARIDGSAADFVAQSLADWR